MGLACRTKVSLLLRGRWRGVESTASPSALYVGLRQVPQGPCDRSEEATFWPSHKATLHASLSPKKPQVRSLQGQDTLPTGAARVLARFLLGQLSMHPRGSRLPL